MSDLSSEAATIEAVLSEAKRKYLRRCTLILPITSAVIPAATCASIWILSTWYWGLVGGMSALVLLQLLWNLVLEPHFRRIRRAARRQIATQFPKTFFERVVRKELVERFRSQIVNVKEYLGPTLQIMYDIERGYRAEYEAHHNDSEWRHRQSLLKSSARDMDKRLAIRIGIHYNLAMLPALQALAKNPDLRCAGENVVSDMECELRGAVIAQVINNALGLDRCLHSVQDMQKGMALEPAVRAVRDRFPAGSSQLFVALVALYREYAAAEYRKDSDEVSRQVHDWCGILLATPPGALIFDEACFGHLPTKEGPLGSVAVVDLRSEDERQVEKDANAGVSLGKDNDSDWAAFGVCLIQWRRWI